MKAAKRISLLLTAAMIFSMMIFSASAAIQILSVGADYTCSTPFTDANGYDYAKFVSGEELTDGIIGVKDYGTDWVGFHKNNSDFSETFIEIDFGKVTDTINTMTVVTMDDGEGGIVKHPTSVVFVYSTDGENYKKVTSKLEVTTANNVRRTEVIIPGDGVSARYIKVIMCGDSTSVLLFAGEFEATSVQDPSYTVTPDRPDASTHPVYLGAAEAERTPIDTKGIKFNNYTPLFVDKSYVCGVGETMTVQDVLDSLLDTEKVTYLRDGKEPAADSLVCTGDVISYTGTPSESYSIVKKGDVSGDGAITAIDYFSLKKHVLNVEPLENEVYKAACIVNEKPTAIDYFELKKHVLKVTNILDEYIQQIDDYDLGNIEYPVTISLDTAGNTYTIDSQYNEHTLRMSLYKTAWGTYNLGAWIYDGKDLAGGATDWEYVYRTSYSNGSSWSWSGGNHNNETMLSMTVADLSTGEIVDLKPGEISSVGELVIYEKTLLHLGNADNSYAEVTREYHFRGNNITLKVDYSYTKDTWQFLSYTGMFPVRYDYGKYISYDDGTTFKTTSAGINYGSVFHDGKATKAIIYGDKNTDYKFTVESFTKGASFDDFSNGRGCMYWEMNTSHQKLYLSKYKESSSTKVEAGTRMQTVTSWTFEEEMS